MNVKPAEGKLGVLCVGLGAVATTFMTGVLMVRKGLAKPVGSMTQYDKIRVGRGAEKKYLHYNEIVPMAELSDIVFGAWDVYPANAYESAINCEVLKEKDINPVKDELEKIVPMKAAFDHNYAKRLDGNNVKDCATRWDMVEQLREDIRRFKAENGCSRIVVLWAASTEIYVPVCEEVHGTLEALEKAMKADDREHIAPSMCYAYAALSEGAPFIMGAPNTTVDIPAMWEMAEKTKMPIAGKRLQDGTDVGEVWFCSDYRHTLPGTFRMVLYQHPRQPRRTGARRTGKLPYKGGEQAFDAGVDSCSGKPARPVYRLLS